ncbi:hypothetical protein BDU57DRAFT_521327 [Ampelomyces quisqualis]|uniref:Uncharacterized protein n=1 Tax=Ampelomyces quisqualis TaxID=50730 RepID=A0A6A5QD30_AMPQU|nr:hypothetical protein BDU57DRAFT_521327 [Ampelomyces quisqualis]
MTSSKETESTSGSGDGNAKDAVSDQDVRQESSKAASAAVSAQKKAAELRDAAASAGEPAERRKLMQEAIDKEIEAESFGKTAKYLNSGAFQGMAVGAGLGTAPSATLGALTGTLVGGVTWVLTAGLGGGIGAAAGAIHGPMVSMGGLAGKGLQKLAGNLPEWVATQEQTQALEKMIGQVKEEHMPDENELQKLQEEGGNAAPDEGWMNSIQGMLPSMKGVDKPEGGKKDNDFNKQDENEETDAETRKKPRKLEPRSKKNLDESHESKDTKKRPRKLKTKSKASTSEPGSSKSTK